MKRKGARGLGVLYWVSPVANEKFTKMLSEVDKLFRPQSGWDPYEVWRTRVKRSSAAMEDREHG